MSQTTQNIKRGRINKTNKYCNYSEHNHATGTAYRQTGTRGQAARMANACASGLEALETRQLFSTISVVSFGATPNSGQDAAGAIQAALNAAKPGDVVSFPAGTYDIDATLNVPSGITLQGASYTTTHVDFTVPSGSYAFSLNSSDSNVTIEGLDIHSSAGAISMIGGGGYTNISILGNAIQALGPDIPAINDTNYATNLTIDYNWFHDGPVGSRQFYLFGPIASHVDHNLFTNVWDCGQIESSFVAGDVFSYQYNYGTDIMNKGAEFQNQFGPSEVGGLNASYNVFYDWQNVEEDTFGLSLPLNYTTNYTVTHNYIAATLAPGASFGPEPAGIAARFGYGIEAGGTGGLVSDNTIIGPWAGDISVTTAGVKIDSNSFYGSPYPGNPYWTTEPSIAGVTPSIILGTGSLANTTDGNIADAPPPPANTFAGPAFMPGSSSSGSSGSSSGGGTSSGSTPSAPVNPPAPTAPVSAGPEIPAGTGVQVSSLTPTSEVSGDGPIGINQSNGGSASGDGKTITIDGQEYATGVGVDANSDLTYNLDGKYTQFLTDIGIDDETDGGGQVTFEILGDGKQLYQSGTMKGYEAAVPVSVNVTGIQQLQLIVQAAESGVTDNHADWANARLIADSSSTSNPPSTPVTPPTSGGSSSSGSSGTTSSSGGGLASGTIPHAPTTPSTPTSPPSSSAPPPPSKKKTTKKPTHKKSPSSGVPTPGGVTALSALELVSESDGYGQPGTNEANNGTGPLEISGTTYADGVGVNANSKLTYQLSGDFNKFVAEIGVDDASSRGSQVEFEVWADGHELYNSGAMTEGQEKSVDVRITGAQQLTLVTVNLGDPNNVEADWAAAHVE